MKGENHMKNIKTIRRAVAAMANQLHKLGYSLSQAFKTSWKRVKNSMKCRASGVTYEKRRLSIGKKHWNSGPASTAVPANLISEAPIPRQAFILRGQQFFDKTLADKCHGISHNLKMYSPSQKVFRYLCLCL